jgi:predicted nucleotide-binding protein
MTITRRIFVSSPREEYLKEKRRKELKKAIAEEIEALGYEVQMFGSAEESRGLASRKSWSPSDADEVMHRCVGAAILGFPIWQCSAAGETVSLVTEYCHYEGAIARKLGLPILAVLDDGVAERVFFNRYGGDPFIRIPAEADPIWVKEGSFRPFLDKWNEQLGLRKDIFLAYSGKLEGTAGRIKTILTQLGVTVLDWKKDFVGGRTILEQVEDAALRTSGGVFLFTRDDLFKGKDKQAAPRDNVIFEAGFFAHSKGHERTLIIREAGAKMPADLGGIVYETLPDRAHVHDLEKRLQLFLETSI